MMGDEFPESSICIYLDCIKEYNIYFSTMSIIHNSVEISKLNKNYFFHWPRRTVYKHNSKHSSFPDTQVYH